MSNKRQKYMSIVPRERDDVKRKLYVQNGRKKWSTTIKGNHWIRQKYATNFTKKTIIFFLNYG